MADNYSLVVENAREELLSSDLLRSEALGQTQMLDQFSDQGRSDDAPIYNADFGATKGERNNSTGATRLPTLVAGAGFQMTLGQFQILVNDGGSGSDLNNEASSYKVFRGTGATVTFAVPDATNPRIDLVVMTDGTINTDLQSRNILLDPIARTVASQIVPKRQNPQVTVSVITGTPTAGSVPGPLPPALGVGQIAVFEVLIPAAALSAAEFSTSRCIFRRVEFPNSTAHGILQGCQLSAIGATGIGDTGLPVRQNVPHKVLIDGEVITFHNGLSIGGLFGMVVPDTLSSNNPFAVAAPATTDKPFYIYVCGGRNLPQGRQGAPWGPNLTLEPVCVVTSLTIPGADGRPLAPIQTPRGPTKSGALYIGVGWVAAGTTSVKSATYSGDWCAAGDGSFMEPALAPITLADTPIALTSCPAVSDQAWVNFVSETTTVPEVVRLRTNLNAGFAPLAPFVGYAAVLNLQGIGLRSQAQSLVSFPAGITPQLSINAIVNNAIATGDIRASAFNMNVRRYGSY